MRWRVEGRVEGSRTAGQMSQLEEQPSEAALQQLPSLFPRPVVTATLSNNKQRPRLQSIKRPRPGGSATGGPLLHHLSILHISQTDLSPSKGEKEGASHAEVTSGHRHQGARFLNSADLKTGGFNLLFPSCL